MALSLETQALGIILFSNVPVLMLSFTSMANSGVMLAAQTLHSPASYLRSDLVVTPSFSLAIKLNGTLLTVKP
jgi:hypothetical protein